MGKLSPEEKTTLLVERDDLYDRYLEILTRIEAWEAGKVMKAQSQTSQNLPLRRREIAGIMREHLIRISEKMRKLDEKINPPNYE